MLKTKKTFHLVNDEEKSQREHMYQRKNCRWANLIVLPVLIGFALLLILVNVDFSGKAYDKPESTSEAVPEASFGPTTPPSMTSTLETEPDSSLSFTIDIEQEDQPPRNFEISLLWERSNCFDVTDCLYLCDFGTVGSISNAMEKMQPLCNKNMTLVLQQCTLPSGRLKQDFLRGSYRLENFTIDNCGLQAIEEGAFEHTSTKSLSVLQLKHSLLITLDSSIFTGLNALQHFILTNVQQVTAFKAEQFLQPLASTLEYVELQHQSDRDIYDPTYWLGGEVDFTQLHTLNMSGNRFASYLRQETFLLMSSLEILYLSHCEISYIDNGTFDPLMDTLQLLDLSYNQLLTLSWDFLGSPHIYIHQGFQLLAHENPWNCSCDNMPLIYLMHQNMDAKAECSSPEALKGVSLSSVQLDCDDYGDDVTTTSGNTITAEDNSSSDGDSSSSTSETEESGEPTQDAATTTGPLQTTTTAMNTTTSEDTTSTSSASEGTTTTTSSSAGTTTNIPTSAETTTNISPSTTTEGPTVLPPIYTTTTTESIHPTDSPWSDINLKCTHGNSQLQYAVRKRDVAVKIVTVSPTSVRLYIGDDVTQFRLVYFYQNSDYNTNDLEEDEEEELKLAAMTPTVVTRTATTDKNYQEILIDRLFNNQTYTFCLVQRALLTTSPFNCISHHLYVPVNSERIWLEDDDIAWFVSLVALTVVLCLYIGLHITYCLLRVRPKLLRGSSGVQPLNDHSNKVLLFPTKAQISLEEQQVFSEYIKNHGSLSDIYSSDMSLQMNSHDYMQFYRNLEQLKVRKATVRQENCPPAERAPHVPAPASSCERPISSQFLMPREATIYEVDEENQYESVEYYYQELY